MAGVFILAFKLQIVELIMGARSSATIGPVTLVPRECSNSIVLRFPLDDTVNIFWNLIGIIRRRRRSHGICGESGWTGHAMKLRALAERNVCASILLDNRRSIGYNGITMKGKSLGGEKARVEA
jgi:hypothetical protein